VKAILFPNISPESRARDAKRFHVGNCAISSGIVVTVTDSNV